MLSNIYMNQVWILPKNRKILLLTIKPLLYFRQQLHFAFFDNIETMDESRQQKNNYLRCLVILASAPYCGSTILSFLPASKSLIPFSSQFRSGRATIGIFKA
jgi:hypothetical protein